MHFVIFSSNLFAFTDNNFSFLPRILIKWVFPQPLGPNILILLIVGSFTGGYFGAHLAKLRGNALIKKTFTIICFSVGISLFIKSIISIFK